MRETLSGDTPIKKVAYISIKGGEMGVREEVKKKLDFSGFVPKATPYSVAYLYVAEL